MTAEEHKRFLEQGFDDVSPDNLIDISKIRIDRGRTLKRRKKQYVRATKNPYLVRVDKTMVKIKFANNGVSFEEAFENLLLMS